MTQLQETTVNQSYSLTVRHIGMLAQLAEFLGQKKSEIVRDAIEHYYSLVFDGQLSEKSATASES